MTRNRNALNSDTVYKIQLQKQLKWALEIPAISLNRPLAVMTTVGVYMIFQQTSDCHVQRVLHFIWHETFHTFSHYFDMLASQQPLMVSQKQISLISRLVCNQFHITRE